MGARAPSEAGLAGLNQICVRTKLAIPGKQDLQGTGCGHSDSVHSGAWVVGYAQWGVQERVTHGREAGTSVGKWVAKT